MTFRRIELAASDNKPSGEWAPDTLSLSQLCEMLTLYQNVTLVGDDHSEFTIRCDMANRDAIEFAVYRLNRR